MPPKKTKSATSKVKPTSNKTKPNNNKTKSVISKAKAVSNKLKEVNEQRPIENEIEEDSDAEEKSSADETEDEEDDNFDAEDAEEDIREMKGYNDDDDEEEAVFTYKEPIRGDREIIVVKKEHRITSDLLSKEEMTEAISERIRQLEKESVAFVDISDLTDPVSIAKREMNMRKCPLILRRKIGSKVDPITGTLTEYYEYWDVNEMEHRFIYDV